MARVNRDETNHDRISDLILFRICSLQDIVSADEFLTRLMSKKLPGLKFRRLRGEGLNGVAPVRLDANLTREAPVAYIAAPRGPPRLAHSLWLD